MPEALVASAEITLVTFASLYLGLLFPLFTAKTSKYRLTILIAVASGIVFWLFLDLMGDAADLGVNQGFTGGVAHISLAALFAVALLGLFWLDRRSETNRRIRDDLLTLSYTTALLAAVGIGIHSLGEGAEIGSLIGYSYQIGSTPASLVSLVGGIGSGVAYLLHKFLEGLVVGVFAAAIKARLMRILALGLLAGSPTIIGLMLGFATPIDTTFLFGAGAAAAIYIEYKLIPILVQEEHRIVFVIALLLGFYLMYLAGLFHA